MYKKEQLFYNPLLNPDDITIDSYSDNVNSEDFDQPQPAELITGLLGEASNPDTALGQVILDVDSLFYDNDLPETDSIIFQAKAEIDEPANADKTIRQIFTDATEETAIGQL